VETDASEEGIGAVLMQDIGPIAFWSEALCFQNQIGDYPTIEKELLALRMAVSKWRHYLRGAPFIIKTDHQRNFFENRNSRHNYGLTKLLGLNYIIH
jgi:hypothetical protein